MEVSLPGEEEYSSEEETKTPYLAWCCGCWACCGSVFIIAAVVIGLMFPPVCAYDGTDYSYLETISGATRNIVTNGNHQPAHPLSLSLVAGRQSCGCGCRLSQPRLADD